MQPSRLKVWTTHRGATLAAASTDKEHPRSIHVPKHCAVAAGACAAAGSNSMP